MAPTIFIVPGFWEGLEVFRPLEKALHKAGLSTHTSALITTGTKSPGNPTIAEAAKALQEDLLRAVEEAGEDQVIVLLHSAGGTYGSAALRGLSTQSRQAKGLVGGVANIVFLSAIIVEEGDPKDLTPKGITAAQLEQAGVVSVNDGQMVVVDPAQILFNDISPEAAVPWIEKVRPEPVEGWQALLTYMGWRDIPSIYIICDEDRIIPPSLQEQFAGLSQSQAVRIQASHMAMVSQPEEVAQHVIEVARKVSAGLPPV